LPGERLQGGNERFADRIHQGAGGEPVAAVKSKEAGHSFFPLQAWNVNVQVHSINSFHFQRDVVGEHFGNTS